jgi:GT2 family glycosyltransferase
VSDIAVVIPTLGRPAMVARVLDRLERQTAPAEAVQVLVVADAQERDLPALDRVVAGRPFETRRLQAARPGASAARNAGWRAASAPLVLFLDDDVLPEPQLVAEHLAWHRREPAEPVGVLGHVRWADGLRVTPFMRWLEHGIQFDYPAIEGVEAGWGRFYTANASVKRALVERVGGFDEERLPFGYEDLDLALRMHEQEQFRLLYNRAAVAEHLHEMDLGYWRRRVPRIARAERRFTELHPGFEPYFFKLFSQAAAAPPAKAPVARLARVLPRSTPVIGPLVWGSLNGVYLQALAPAFLEAWHAAGDHSIGVR